MRKFDKFFELAKKAGIEECEFSVASSYSLSFSLFHGEIDDYQTNESYTYFARGIYKGKMGAIISDTFEKGAEERFIKTIIQNASVIENDDPVFIFKGSKKYKRISTFNKELANISIKNKLDNLYKLEEKIKSIDKRVFEVQSVGYSESAASMTMMNSHGLKLSEKTNYYVYYGAALAKVDEQVKSGFEMFFDNDFSHFDVDKLAEAVVEETVSQLNGHQCESATYKAVLSPKVVNSLMSAYIGSAIAEDVQKNSSLFVGKINQKVASNKVTISSKPLAKTLFARSFDDEGVATQNIDVIKNGTLMNYFYNLTTAAKDGVESNGHGSVGAGSKVYTSTWFLEMKPGKKSQDELFALVGNGVYITDVQGLHAGLNPRSGNFSLQSTGFMIENGKVTHPLDIITVSGNLVDLFKSIQYVGSDAKMFVNAACCPSVLVKKIAVSGK